MRHGITIIEAVSCVIGTVREAIGVAIFIEGVRVRGGIVSIQIGIEHVAHVLICTVTDIVVKLDVERISSKHRAKECQIEQRGEGVYESEYKRLCDHIVLIILVRLVVLPIVAVFAQLLINGIEDDDHHRVDGGEKERKEWVIGVLILCLQNHNHREDTSYHKDGDSPINEALFAASFCERVLFIPESSHFIDGPLAFELRSSHCFLLKL